MLPLLPFPTRFPKPDWPAIAAQLEGREHTVAELNGFWTERGRSWVALLRDALGAGYRGYESANFWLISNQPEATCRRLIRSVGEKSEASREAAKARSKSLPIPFSVPSRLRGFA